MPSTATSDRVTVHLKLDRPVRQKVIGNLHMQGMTMQDFFEQLMQTLAAEPERIAEVNALAQERARRQAVGHA